MPAGYNGADIVASPPPEFGMWAAKLESVRSAGGVDRQEHASL